MQVDDLIGLRVKHKYYGLGIIKSFSKNLMTIEFTGKEARFVYPDAFKDFITADDELVQAEIVKEINHINISQKAQQTKPELDSKTTEKSLITDNRNATKIEIGFSSDYNVKYLSKHPILNYRQVEEQFGIRISGFGRGISITPSTLVLISSIQKKKSGFVYHDHWTTDGDYIYSGEGKTGNQILSKGNKAILDSVHDKKTIHLFVKFSPQEYYYQGEFSLVDYSYEDDKDESGNLRKEYKFRLKNSHSISPDR